MADVHTVAITNQKGGTAKTTSAAALAAILAERYRVLLVDFDTQASLTQSLDVKATANISHVIGGAEPGARDMRSIIQSLNFGFDIVPSGIELASCELGLSQRLGRETVLSRALASVDYDVVLVDCPPALGLLTINALMSANAVIIPTQPTSSDLIGVRMFLGTLDRIREIKPIELLGVIVTQADLRTIAHRDALSVLRASMNVLGVVPRSVVVQESATAKQPLPVYAPEHKTTKAYREIAGRLAAWLNQR